MCGIVLAGGNLSGSDLEIFNQLLYCDVFRGQHSTGVFCRRPNEEKVSFFKEALPSFAYLLEPEYKEMSTGKTAYTVSPLWMVGHNRHATRGAVNSQNAHPFQHGDITLVHNGTLVDQSLLPEHRNFVVDSENICYSINKIGAEATIQKLDGAYTLIWHDAKDDTLHIIRNDERPFHLCRVGNDWFGASEEDMLMWILKRSKSHRSRVGEHFECKVGVEYIFDVKARKMTLIEEKEHKLPVFTLASRWDRSSSWIDQYYQDERYERHSNANAARASVGSHSSVSPAAEARRKAEIDKQNNLAKDRGLDIRRDQTIEFTPCMFTPYTNAYNLENGKMTGYIFDDTLSEYFEIDVHNISKADYEACMDNPKVKYSTMVVCISEINGMIRVVGSTGKWVGLPSIAVSSKEPDVTGSSFDDDIPFDMSGTCVTGAGISVTRKFWESHAHGECAGCGKHIEWEDAPKALFAYQSYWHPDCLKKVGTEEEDTPNELVVCSVCSQIVTPSEIDSEMSSFKRDDICKPCANDVRSKARQIQLREGVWAKVKDMTTAREPEISIRVTPSMLARMIIMGESISKEIKMEDVEKCYIERRVGGNYAIALLPEGCKSPKDIKKEEIADKARTFRQQQKPTAIRKIVKSIDGNRELEVTKALWSQIGYCEYCYQQVLWKDVEACSLGNYQRIVCPSEKCRGKNGSQKNST